MNLVLRNRPALSPYWLNSWYAQPPVSRRSAQAPAINVKETDTAYELAVAAPGLTKEDFKLSVENDRLTLAADRQAGTEANTDRYTRREFTQTSFKRVFSLPETVDTDGIHATYENGVLLVNLPKVPEAAPVVKEIAVV